MPTLEQSIITLLIFGVVGLLLYVLRTSAIREKEILSHKDRLLALLERYAATLADLTVQIASVSRTQENIERRMERVEALLLAVVGNEGHSFGGTSGGIVAQGNSVLHVGRDVVGGDETKKNDSR